MLTDAEIDSLIKSGALVRWEPRLGGRVSAQHRVILLAPSVAAEIDAPRWPLSDEEPTRGPKLRRQAFHAQLARFVEGGNMIVTEEIKRLTPKNAHFEDLFAFRSRPPNPQVRLLGYFARPGVFVGTAFRQRDELVGEDEWTEAAKSASEHWRSITPKKPMAAPNQIRTKAELARYIDE